MRAWIVALAALVAACGQSGADGEAAEAPKMEDPAAQTEPARGFEPANDQTRAATGVLNVTVATRLPEAVAADRGDEASTETLTLTGANGVVVEATLAGVVEPSVQVQGQTLRALMGLTVEASQILVYRVARAEGTSLCGATAASHVVVWEPSSFNDPSYKLLPVSGGAPGEAGARPCAALEYRRS